MDFGKAGFLCAAAFVAAQAAPLKARSVFESVNAMPMAMAHAGDARVWVAQRNGTITVFANRQARTGSEFLKVAAHSCLCINDESGLLGLAFHPDFLVKDAFGYGKLYVFHTVNASGHDGLYEYRVSGDPATATRADASTRRQLLLVTTGGMHHNGGSLAFDGGKNLLLGIGDGNRGDQSRAWAQSLDVFHGKLLRLDPAGATPARPYGIPADNPEWPGRGRNEIYAMGLRNPYRIHFDKAARGGAGALLVGDVGQSAWEEINLVEAGKNYGWGNQEGDLCVTGPCGGYAPPLHQYPFTGGAAVIGGIVYRGKAMPQRRGQYFFADYYYEMKVMADPYAAGSPAVTEERPLGRPTVRNADEFFSFGEDPDGEVYSLHWTGIYILEESTPSSVTPPRESAPRPERRTARATLAHRSLWEWSLDGRRMPTP